MDDMIRAAFDAAPRRRFLPKPVRRYWRMDRPLSLGKGQTNSQPSTVANMLELLNVERGMKVLDVGAGSGWTTALLAELVGPGGRVIGVERISSLATRAAEVVSKGGWPQAEIRRAQPSVFGAPEDAPFDRILVSAEANELPKELVAQLADGGVMVIPVAGVMMRITRFGDQLSTTEHGYYVFVPLVAG